MHVDGTRVHHALGMLQEQWAGAWYTYQNNDVSVIERFKKRNYAVAVTTAVVVTVASVAFYIFSLVYFVLLNPNYQEPDPLYSERLRTNSGAEVGAILGIVFGTIIIPGPEGAGVWALTNYTLDHNTVEPLRKVKERLEALHDNQQLLGAEHLIELMKRCDTRAQKELVATMNFEQLTHARGVLSAKAFKNLIKPIDKEAHYKWKLIMEFSGLSVEKKLQALQTEGIFQTTLSKHPEMTPIIRQECYKLSGQARFQALSALDAASGLTDPTYKQIELTFESGAKRTYTVNWVASKCEWLQEFLNKSGADSTKIPTALLECLDIIQGHMRLPDNLQTLGQVATNAVYYGMPELVEMVGNVLLEKARNKKVSKVDVISMIAQHIPNEARYAPIKSAAMQLSGYNTIHSHEEFTLLWKISKNWDAMRAMCTTYFTNLLDAGKNYRLAHETAEELDCPILRQLCMTKLSQASPSYKTSVKNCYGINDMPQEVFIWIK